MSECDEPAQIFRALERRLKTRGVDRTHEQLQGQLLTHRVVAEVQALYRRDTVDPRGKSFIACASTPTSAPAG